MTFVDLVEKLKNVKEIGYVQTHRSGNTGIGKTLEDLLEIEENNIPGPNAALIELKSARKNTLSMLTLFTKSPQPSKVNTKLLKRFGYDSARGNKRKELHTTINTESFNQLKGRPGFKIKVGSNRLYLINIENEELCYWERDLLKNAFERKIPKLLYVKCKGGFQR